MQRLLSAAAGAKRRLSRVRRPSSKQSADPAPEPALSPEELAAERWEAQAALLEEELQRVKRIVAGLQEALIQRDEEAVLLEGEVDRLNEVVVDLQDTVVRRDAEAARREDELEDLHETAVRQQAALAWRSEEAERREHELEQLWEVAREQQSALAWWRDEASLLYAGAANSPRQRGADFEEEGREQPEDEEEEEEEVEVMGLDVVIELDEVAEEEQASRRYLELDAIEPMLPLEFDEERSLAQDPPTSMALAEIVAALARAEAKAASAEEEASRERALREEAEAEVQRAREEADSAAECLRVSLPALTGKELEEVTDNFSNLLGVGGFGEVFAGRGAEGEVAVKVAVANGARRDEQFLREVRAGCLCDDCLVPVLAVCLERRALVYPKAALSLEDRLRAELRPGPGEGLAHLLGAARGLLALHRHGLIHRDVKSSNVLLFPTPDGAFQHEARLGDCGWVGELPEEGATELVGTGPYLDPEAARSGRVAASSDVFSLGAVVLEVLLRRSVTEPRSDARPLWRQLNQALPARGTSEAAVIAAAAMAFIRGAGAGGGWEPEALEAVAVLAARALEEYPDGRPTAGAVVKELEAAEVRQRLAPREDEPPSPPRLCGVCMEEPAGARLRPCFHSLVCAGCAALFVGGQCPVCRAEVQCFELGDFHSTFSPE